PRAARASSWPARRRGGSAPSPPSAVRRAPPATPPGCRSCAPSSTCHLLSGSAETAYIVSTMANDAFKALAHPLRRDIVERLSGGVATVGDVTRDFGVPTPTISRHAVRIERAFAASAEDVFAHGPAPR